MGDMGDHYRALKEEKKKRHSDWHKKNIAIIKKSGLQYEVKNNGECVIINSTKFDDHVRDKPQIDFFPSTGRWRSKGRTMSGGAQQMINWYNKQ